MSPGSRPRPSLSGLQPPGHRGRRGGVAGVSAPAFVERARRSAGSRTVSGVAGVSAPAFVERSCPVPGLPTCGCVAGVSAPAFVERSCPVPGLPTCGCVAGVSAPAFVERSRAGSCTAGTHRVSPGSRPRPSLSELSVRYRNAQEVCVAGVSAPAFVERITGRTRWFGFSRVAGVLVPAFVERARSGLWARCGLCGRRVSAPLTPLRRWQDDKA